MYSIAFNASSKWYFKDCKGIREGDPVSPFLFVLVVEGFNKITLSKVVASQKFKFHPSCASQKSTRVCFADGLLLLAIVDFPFLLLFQEALEEFKNLSRLSVNHSNSHSSSKSKLYSPTLMVQHFLCFHYCP